MPVARQGGLPDYNPSGAIDFIPELYSGKLVEKFYKSTVFGEIAQTDYEGEIAGFGSNVVIRTVPNITVSDYTIGAGLTYQYPQSNSVNLAIDKAKSFAVAVNRVDQGQSDLDLADIFANDGSIQLRISADSTMLTTIPTAAGNSGATAGADSANINMGTTAAPRSVSATNVIDYLVDHGQVLDEQSVGDEGRWIVVPPWMVARIKKSDLKIASLAGDGVSILRNGKVGEIDRFTVYQSRSLLTQPTPAATNIMAGHRAGLTFAAQISELEVIPNPNDFGILVRGLLVFGFSAVAPAYLTRSVASAG